jgi:hypothetical protein
MTRIIKFAPPLNPTPPQSGWPVQQDFVCQKAGREAVTTILQFPKPVTRHVNTGWPGSEQPQEYRQAVDHARDNDFTDRASKIGRIKPLIMSRVAPRS